MPKWAGQHRPAETLDYHPSALYWRATIRTLARSNVAKMTTRGIYQDVTVRNLNTTRKLDALMTAVAKAGEAR
jgi:hypothetical protein